jgi:predicted outer membrane repeat protein
MGRFVRTGCSALVLLAAGLGFVASAPPAAAGGPITVVVQTTADGLGPSPRTLRSAANASGDVLTVDIPPGTYHLSICATAGVDENLNANGDLDHTSANSITLRRQGTTGTVVIVQDCPAERVLESVGNVILENVQLRDGLVQGDGGLVRTTGSFAATGSRLDGGFTGGDGGAVWAAGSVQLTDSAVHDNQADDHGGGVHAGGFVALTRSAVTGNEANEDGGGIWAQGTGDVSLDRSVVGDDEANRGGGIFLGGAGTSVVLEDSTVAQNQAFDTGGGIYTAGQVVASQSTLARNEAVGGGGANVHAGHLDSAESVYADAFGIGATSCALTSASTSLGNNFQEGGSSCGLTGSGDVTNGADPGFRPLLRNGGPTVTLGFGPTSVLRDAASPCASSGTDQRGVTRLLGSGCDTGAVEVQPCGTFFADVAATHPFCWEIGWMAAAGVTTGFAGPPATFRSADAVTRQSMAAFLYRLAGSPPFVAPENQTFADVAPPNPFYREVEWLNAAQISTGFPGNLYKPTAVVTRQSMSAFMYRLAGEPEVGTTGASFSDVSASHPFFEPIEWMVQQQITTGFPGGTFRPSAPVTRQSMSAFMYRLAPVLVTEVPL